MSKLNINFLNYYSCSISYCNTITTHKLIIFDYHLSIYLFIYLYIEILNVTFTLNIDIISVKCFPNIFNPKISHKIIYKGENIREREFSKDWCNSVKHLANQSQIQIFQIIHDILWEHSRLLNINAIPIEHYSILKTIAFYKTSHKLTICDLRFM